MNTLFACGAIPFEIIVSWFGLAMFGLVLAGGAIFCIIDSFINFRRE